MGHRRAIEPELPDTFLYSVPAPTGSLDGRVAYGGGSAYCDAKAGELQIARACLARAKAHSLKFSIENHTHTLIPEAASFLRLSDAVHDPDLGCNLDVGWAMLQKEYPPIAIHKLKGRLLNVHMRDIDGSMRLFPPMGDGVMDCQAIVATLKQIGFNGFASIEQDTHPGDPEMRVICQRYLKMMREYIG